MHDIYSVAGSIAEHSNWTLSNLSLQKLTYLAQMMHIGETDQPMFAEDFEAWDYGPVVPKLYHNLKMFGADPVERYSSLTCMKSPTADQKRIIADVTDFGVQKKPGELVSITHWKNGAWAKVYAKNIKGLTIPKQLIRAEYLERLRDSADA